jgi:hypothetical protein
MLNAVDLLGPSERKVRLFNAAACRRFWGYLAEASRAVLIHSEGLADGIVQPGQEGTDLCRLANAVVAPIDRQYPARQYPNQELRIQRFAAAAVCYAVTPNDLWNAAGIFWDLDRKELIAHCNILRDIFGNPFRPATIDPSWLAWNDGLIVKLAQGIFEDRAFDRMPILADALEEAGCTDEVIFGHCRQEGEHVRGCWLMDLLTGQS